MQFITGKVSEIVRCKVTIGETEITVDWFASRKISVGDEIVALIEGEINGMPLCIAFRNLRRNVSFPSQTNVILSRVLGVIAILFGIMVFLTSPYKSPGGLSMTGGILGFFYASKFRQMLDLLDAEIARQESQDQEKV
jgi:hypothetical protein